MARTCSTCPRDLLRAEHGRAACRICEHRIRRALREIVLQLPLLAASLERDRPGGVPVATRHPGRSEAAPPPREDVLTLLGPHAPGDVTDPHHDQHGPLPITGTLAAWCWHIAAQHRGAPIPYQPTPAFLAAWLGVHLTWACAQPWISELDQELRQLLARIRGITRTGPRRRSLDVPCVCGAFGLAAEDWATYVECDVCGRLYTDPEYAAHAAALIRLGVLIAAHHMTTQPGTADPTTCQDHDLA